MNSASHTKDILLYQKICTGLTSCVKLFIHEPLLHYLITQSCRKLEGKQGLLILKMSYLLYTCNHCFTKHPSNKIQTNSIKYNHSLSHVIEISHLIPLLKICSFCTQSQVLNLYIFNTVTKRTLTFSLTGKIEIL